MTFRKTDLCNILDTRLNHMMTAYLQNKIHLGMPWEEVLPHIIDVPAECFLTGVLEHLWYSHDLPFPLGTELLYEARNFTVKQESSVRRGQATWKTTLYVNGEYADSWNALKEYEGKVRSSLDAYSWVHQEGVLSTKSP